MVTTQHNLGGGAKIPASAPAANSNIPIEGYSYIYARIVYKPSGLIFF